MLHAHKLEPAEDAGAEIVVFPARAGARGGFGRRAEPERFTLVVDLAAEEIGPRWFRGAGTLVALCASAIMLAPSFQPFAAASDATPEVTPDMQLASLAMPVLPDESAAAADTLPRPKGLEAGEADDLRRVSGDVSDGLYWSLRGAGMEPDMAAAYLQAISTRIDMGEISPFDRFEYVVKNEAGAAPALLYAGLDRAQGDDFELMKWKVDGRIDWFDGNAGERTSSGLMAPVAGRITSRFGNRTHPILRYSRFHAGVDFGAGHGSPIVAAADGQVVGAGWSGGYGRQVRVAHGGGIVTTYSHMSSIAAVPGTPVRQGEVIGYVGSTGLSTGPHLHFEVRAGGRPVDPLLARLVSRPAMDGRELAAFKARMRELKGIGKAPAGG